MVKAKVERETEPPLKAPSIVWKRFWQPPTARAPRPHMERQLGLVSSGKTGVPEGEISSERDGTKKMMKNLNIIQISHLTFECS